MADTSMFHVMFLTKLQQASLRLIMFDFLAKHVRMNINRIIEAKDPTSAGNDAFVSIVGGIDLYERIVDILPILDTAAHAKDMTLQLNPKSMEYVVRSVNFYDSNNSVLSPQETHFIANHSTGIKDLVNKSKEFTYTIDDIHRVSKKGSK